MGGFTVAATRVMGEGTATGRLVLLEPDDSVRDALTTLLRSQGWGVELAGDTVALRELLRSEKMIAVICEASLPGSDAAAVLGTCTEEHVPLIFTGHDLAAQAAVDLVRLGAADYLEKPFSRQRLLERLDQLSQAAWRGRETNSDACLA